jgi:uncharacterized protein YybS (DUF2232 family)
VSGEASVRERTAVSLATGALVAAAFSLAVSEPRLGLVGLVSGLPLALCRLRAGREASLLAALVAAALVSGFFSLGQGLGLLLVIAAPALVMGEALASQRGVLAAAVRGGALLGLEVSLGLLLAGPEMASQLLEPLREYQSEAFLTEMRQQRGLPEEQVVELQRQFATLESALAVVYPAAWLLLSWTVALVLAALLRLWLARRGPRWLDGPGFEDLRLPIGVVALFLVSGLAVVSPPLRPLAYNALLVLGFLFGLQGLAVAVFYTGRMRGPRPLRAAIVVLMLLIPLGAQILALAGLFDNFFDFRRWAEPPQAGSGTTAEGDDSARG